MRTTRLRLLALAAGLVLAVAACGGGGDSNRTLESGGGDDASDLAFTATSLEGEPVALADYAGQDVMLWFWAPW